MTMVSQAWLIANDREGKWPSPVSITQRVRPSTGACAKRGSGQDTGDLAVDDASDLTGVFFAWRAINDRLLRGLA